MTPTSIPGAMRPTQTPAPSVVAIPVPPTMASLPIDATGRHSVAPYGV